MREARSLSRGSARRGCCPAAGEEITAFRGRSGRGPHATHRPPFRYSSGRAGPHRGAPRCRAFGARRTATQDTRSTACRPSGASRGDGQCREELDRLHGCQLRRPRGGTTIPIRAGRRSFRGVSRNQASQAGPSPGTMVSSCPPTAELRHGPGRPATTAASLQRYLVGSCRCRPRRRRIPNRPTAFRRSGVRRRLHVEVRGRPSVRPRRLVFRRPTSPAVWSLPVEVGDVHAIAVDHADRRSRGGE